MPASSTSTPQIMALESRVAAPNYLPIAVVLERGSGEWLFDVDGRRYLDLMSAYSAVSHGHAHPRLVRALVEQAQRVAVTSRAYYSSTLGPFLAKLTSIAGLDLALPSSGGAEAVETAIKAARRWGYRVKGIAADRANIVVARGNFHGRSTAIVGFSTEPAYREHFGPFAPGFKHFDFGDPASLAAAIDEDTCAVLVEPIQGEAGIIVPPDGFLREVRALCDRRRVLLILDEIQSGLGRTGRWFAFQHEGIRPDGLILGKALGGGLLPVSCFVARREVLEQFEPGSHGSTFGGNPLAAAVGLEALNVIEDEQLVGRSAALGEHLLQRLRRLDSPLIVDVRGRGLWAGVELDPARVSTRAVVERLAERGVLTKDTHGTVIRIAPPLTIAREALDWGIDVVADTLREFEPRLGRRDSAAAAVASGSAAGAVASRGLQPAAREAASSAPRARLMMSAPEYFEVCYRINPWMDPSAWSHAAARLRDDARRGWLALKSTFERLGACIEVQAAHPGLPDLVFSANSALVLDRRVLLARFRCSQRQGETALNRGFFEALKARGIVDAIDETPAPLFFEGAGDAVWDGARGLLWCGWGQRSSREMPALLGAHFGVPTIALELVDPRFYHLDTCLCVLDGGEVVYYPAAFSDAGRAVLAELVGPERLIEAGDDDALHLGVNSVCLGRDVVLCHASPALRSRLSARGYRPHVVPLDSFNRSGGAAFCLSLRLDRSTLAGSSRSVDEDEEMRAAA